MAKLQTTQGHRFGRNQCLPLIGEVSISKEGFIEVENLDLAKQLEAMNIGFNIVSNKEIEKEKEEVKKEEIRPQTKESKPLEKSKEEGDKLAPQIEPSEPLNEIKVEEISEVDILENGESTDSEEEIAEVPSLDVEESGELEENEVLPNNEELKIEEEPSLEEVKKQKREQLEVLKMTDLQKLVEDFPKKEWSSLNKANLIDFILEQLN